ncbi:EAL domain-containing protein [Baaleninema sp.]|uniref:EAL domain-containing protein n=1 Tax=Baaleninema sp. TaxID=3101197 RepID=UPI003CFF0E2F
MSRILLLVDRKENRRLLAEWLSLNYDVCVAEDDEAIEQWFDLCIVDSLAFQRCQKRLQARQNREYPVSVPILLFCSQLKSSFPNRQLWQFVDEIIVTPIPKTELQVHIAKLLRKRQQSLQLKLGSVEGLELNGSKADRWLVLLELEADLRHAIERNQLQAYYQPIIDLGADRLAGFEALVRWNHPQRGLVSPVTFIPLAERTNQIFEIDRWMLKTACTQLHQWRSRFPEAQHLQMGVNFTSCQFDDEALCAEVARLLEDLDLPPQQLKLEITERSLLEPTDITRSQITQLRSMGVEFYLDDFGIGYSSLNYLNSFPVDGLKLDRSFTQKIGINTNSSEIVKSAIALARKLNIAVVAEGIETTMQQTQLRQWGCRYGQGYLFAKPLEAAAIERQIHQLGGDRTAGRPS